MRFIKITTSLKLSGGCNLMIIGDELADNTNLSALTLDNVTTLTKFSSLGKVIELTVHNSAIEIASCKL